MKIYIATPINGRPEKTFAEKRAAAALRIEELKALLRQDERFASYQEMTSGIDVCTPDMKEPEAIGRCVSEVLRCDAVYMDCGYEQSTGCMTEHDVCRRYKIPVYGENWQLDWEE